MKLKMKIQPENLDFFPLDFLASRRLPWHYKPCAWYAAKIPLEKEESFSIS